MSLVAVGPFPGLKINNYFKNQMILDLTNTREKCDLSNPPKKALESAKKASRIIRRFMDQMNLKNKLNYNLSYEILNEINQIFLDSGFDLKCLMEITIDHIKYRVTPYPLKSLNYSIVHHRVDKISITCTEIW
jgi:hypothetical protein